MPSVNPAILTWARETAGLSLEEAAAKVDLKSARGISGSARLGAYESGDGAPSRTLLAKMAKQYRRPLLAFYLNEPPRRGDRGEDFRSLPADERKDEPLVDALVRDIRARQSMVRSILEDEEAEPLQFVGSMSTASGIGTVLASIRQTLSLETADFRAQASPESAFALLRKSVEDAGVFVLLAGNLGSHHTSIDVEAFRGFALADKLAPFIVINDQDAQSAWSFSLLHELAHIWLGSTGISGASDDLKIEKFCNQVAANFLLPPAELSQLDIGRSTDAAALAGLVSDFAAERHLSSTMVAYALYQTGRIEGRSWTTLRTTFRQQWRENREARRERQKAREGGPNYYVVRRHRLGSALLQLVSRNMSDGSLTPTKASKVLGVKPRSVEPLLRGAALSSGEVA